MNKKARYVIFVALLVSIALIAVKSFAAPAQCNDRRDNDGDTLIDYPADPGCSSKQDNDETDPVTTTTSTSTTTIPDSCNDTDGGFVPGVYGSIYGNFNGNPYIYNDTCITSATLNERICSGSSPFSLPYNCTTTCQNGACT